MLFSIFGGITFHSKDLLYKPLLFCLEFHEHMLLAMSCQSCMTTKAIAKKSGLSLSLLLITRSQEGLLQSVKDITVFGKIQLKSFC